jgi:hypothetical protein
MQSQPAPIERAYPSSPGNNPATITNQTAVLSPGQVLASGNATATAQPIRGLYIRIRRDSAVREVASDAQHTELRVERGLANVNLHNPPHATLILIDLPSGQTQLLKNGLYTFNATTNTVRVLKGEAKAFPATQPTAKPIKVKEDHDVVFNGADIRSTEFDPYEARADLVPLPYRDTSGDRGSYREPYGYGPYSGFLYGYPYVAFGYPWGYPYGGFGLGFGYYGGFHRGFGGFHGGHR